jgi:hypothetical protein
MEAKTWEGVTLDKLMNDNSILKNSAHHRGTESTEKNNLIGKKSLIPIG